MNTFTLTAAVVAAALLAGGPALAQDKSKANCPPGSARSGATGQKAKAPEKIDGQVVSVDQKKGTMTVRNKDGSMHEFKGDADTLRDYKKGDNIELTLRTEPC